MRNLIMVIVGVFLFQSLNAQSFTKITEGDLVNTKSASRSANFLDLNGDGWDDIFISNGPSNGQNNMLYLNNQDGTFTTVVDDPIVNDGAKSDGATFGDANNDGVLEACVVTWYGQKNNYYQGEGDALFLSLENVITQTGSYSETASWGDMDNDGWLDLYVTNSEGNTRNNLFKNTGDGNFIQVSTGPMVSSTGPSRSVDWIDYDNDGDSDIFVTNEGNQKNELFQNDGTGEFIKLNNTEISFSARNSAGSSWADIDNDGDFDLFVANYLAQSNQLYINNNDGTFTEINEGVIVEDSRWSFGSSFADVDNDGDVDLYVCNAFGGVEQNSFYINNGDGTFERDDQSAPAIQSGWTFGCAWGDYNNDGFLDLVLANCKDDDQENALFENNGNENNWFKLRCEGTEANKSAIGTVVKVKANINGNPVWQMRRIAGQSGYNCQNSLTVHFGLGDATRIDSMIIDWGVGEIQTFTNISVNSSCYFIQGDQTLCSAISTQDEALLKPSFTIYPNPSNGDYFQIENPFYPKQDPIKVVIVNQTGKVFFEDTLDVTGTDFSINSTTISRGTYHVVLTQNNKTKSAVLVIQ